MSMDIEDRGICEIKIYRDKTGRTVKSFIPVEDNSFTKKNCAVPMFSGVVRIKVVPLVSDKSQTFEKDFEFAFPDEIKTYLDAFIKFDEICQKRIDENNTKMKTKLAESTATPEEVKNV